MSDPRDVIAARAARELRPGEVVNLGIGIPNRIPGFLDSGTEIHLQTENGLLGVGPRPAEGEVDSELIDAAKQPITLAPGAAAFDSAASFAMIRGGHVDVVVLGIFVVLGLNLDVRLLLDNLWAGLAVMVVFVFVARPATVAVCLGLDRRTGWTRQEAVFITWCRETGVVPVAVAAMLLAEDVPGADIVATLVTFAVVTTLLIQATTAGALLGIFLTGSFLIETVFNIRGIGLLAFEAIQTRDFPIVMGFLVISSVLLMLGNLLSDLVVALVDPRVRFE